jgi:surfeit locus 1 family protein
MARTETPSPARSTPSAWKVVLAALVLFAILCALGVWQVQRLAWKEGLLATIEERIHRPPVAFTDVVAAHEAGQDIEYLPVSVTGTFLHSGERHFFATWKGASGYFVYTPLLRADGSAVLVISMPNNHLQYAVTWFGLAAALAGVVGVWLVRIRREDRAPRP